jgi:hypothetical protein
MKFIHRHRPTPAMVVALAALFVALGGSSYAALRIGSKQIANNSVRSKDVRNNDLRSTDVRNGTLLLKDFRAGQLAAGSPGPQGPQGPPGAPGARGDTGVEKVVTRSDAFSFPASNGATGQYLDDHVQCEPGESVVGGGYTTPSTSSGGQPNTIVMQSRPATATGAVPANGDEPTGWYVEARRNVDVAQTVTFYVLCASAG